jgi:hypothetical protein
MPMDEHEIWAERTTWQLIEAARDGDAELNAACARALQQVMAAPRRQRSRRLAALLTTLAKAGKECVLVAATAYKQDPETIFAELRETAETVIRASALEAGA